MMLKKYAFEHEIKYEKKVCSIIDLEVQKNEKKSSTLHLFQLNWNK